MDVAELFKDQPLYCIIVILSLVTGLVYFILTDVKNKNFKYDLTVFCVSGVLSIISSVLVCLTVSKAFSNEKYAYRSVFSIFYAFITFPVFLFVLQKALNLPFDLSPFLNSIILSMFLARIACLTEGCCDGSIHAVKIEMIILALFFVYNVIKRNLYPSVFYAVYSLWRFIADFFKFAYEVERFGPFSVVQYLALIVIALSISIIIYKRRRKNEKK